MDFLSQRQKFLGLATAGVRPLWVTGLALASVFLSSLVLKIVLGVQGETYEWGTYLTLGTVFPVLLLLFSLPNRFSQELQKTKSVLALICLLGLVVFICWQRQYASIVLTVVHLTLLTLFLRERHDAARWIVCCLVVLAAWSAALTLMWWSSFGQWFLTTDGTLETIYRFILCALSLLLVSVNLNGYQTRENESHTFWSPSNIAAMVLIALASTRSDQLFNTMSYSHWGVIVGPAEMIRQGGWLLWDVPSQYGFLNMLLVAWLPFESVWQSAYVLNSVLLFVSAVILFCILRSIRPGAGNFIFSLAVTLAAVFLMAGWPPALLGPQVFPSIGPFRFIWCYILLAILVWAFRRSRFDDWRVLVSGNISWVIATLWSFESAVCATAIWWPAYLMIILGRTVGTHPEQQMKGRFRMVLTCLLVPPLVLTGVVGCINFYYRLRLGWWPDWMAFSEYSFSFAGGFFALPIDLARPVWVLFLVFSVIGTAAAYLISDIKQGNSLILLTGAGAALWAVSGYFVSRSHPNNVTVLASLICTVIGVTLLAVRHKRADWWAHLVRISLVPVVTIILTATFGNAAFLAHHLSSPKIGYQGDIETHLPVLDDSLLELLRSANVKATDPIVYSAVRVKSVEPAADGLTHDHGVLPPAWPRQGNDVVCCPRAWLPSTPFVLLVPLSEQRRQEYMARFISRVQTGGWLVQNKKEAPYTASAWFHTQLVKTHVPTKVFENDNWQLIWFELQRP